MTARCSCTQADICDELEAENGRLLRQVHEARAETQSVVTKLRKAQKSAALIPQVCTHTYRATHKCAGLVDHSVHLPLLSCVSVQYRVAVVKARALALAMRQQLEDSSKEQAALRGKYDAAVEAAQEVCYACHAPHSCLSYSVVVLNESRHRPWLL